MTKGSSNVFTLPSGGQSRDCVYSCTHRAISIMREARSKLRLIKPDDMDMDEYLVLSHTAASAFVLNNRTLTDVVLSGVNGTAV